MAQEYLFGTEEAGQIKAGQANPVAARWAPQLGQRGLKHMEILVKAVNAKDAGHGTGGAHASDHEPITRGPVPHEGYQDAPGA